MNIYHKLDWDKCLSHEIWEAFKKGWPESDQEVHFFWGLAGKNVPEIQNCICLLYTSPSPRDGLLSRMPSSA